ncbi:Nn.00g073610.m01.CDS01 [Neocucurbitaria sp. VM-36]
MGSLVEEAERVYKAWLADNITCSYPAQKPPPQCFDRMMTINVGKSPSVTTFEIHRGLLCFYSSYFKKLLDGPFKEGGSSSYNIPDGTADTFQMFFSWLYTGTVMETAGVKDVDLEYMQIIDLYVFADFLMVQELKNRALELFFSSYRKWSPHINCTDVIYENTTKNSLLRRLYVQVLLELNSFKNWPKYAEHLPKEFIADLFDFCRKMKIVPGNPIERGSNGGEREWAALKVTHFCGAYHEHIEAEPRPAIDST